MYEVLGLAMQADNQPRAEIERALMSAVTMARTTDDVMYIAQYLSRNGFDARALKLFRQVAAMDPTRFEPYMHGLDVAVRLGDVAGIQWACVGVLGQAWSTDKADVVDIARRTAIVTLKQLRDQKHNDEAKQFETALNEALVRDCLVRVTWNGDAEIDMTVEEPAGTVCSLRNPRTTSGGVLLASNPHRDSITDEGTTEEFVVTKGFSGKYRMLLRRVWGKPTAGKVTVEVYTHYGSKQATLMRKQIPLGETDAMVEFSLKDGRRKRRWPTLRWPMPPNRWPASIRRFWPRPSAPRWPARAIRKWPKPWPMQTSLSNSRRSTIRTPLKRSPRHAAATR